MKSTLIKLVFLSAIIVQSSVIYCQNYDMNINFNDGSTVTYAIDDIRRIEFDNVTSIEGDDQVQEVNQNFKLRQNYPNPFNPSTIIEYQILKTAEVKVSIYNLKGQLIKELLNETKSEGIHQISWDGTDQSSASVSSGIYFYTIQSDDLILSKKMLLMK